MASEKPSALSRVLLICASAAAMAAVQTTAAAPAERPRASGDAAQASAPAAHHSAAAARHRQKTRPTPHKQTTQHERAKDVAVRPAANQPAASSEKSSERRAVFGPLSWGIETNQNVKPRSLGGGEADPDRDLPAGQPPRQTPLQNGLPSFLGLSLKSEFSW